jgi:para-aminobenzoate synthetase component I
VPSTETVPPEPYAWFGGRLATGLVEVSDDLAVLDGAGWWAVLVTFEGRVLCARFADVREAPLPAARWHGVPLAAWGSSLDRGGYLDRVATVRDGIAAGDHYQVNLCRVLSAPLPPGADLRGLAVLLAAGNPAPYAGVLRLPDMDVDVVSASPELCLARDGDRVSSGPIKGTATTAAGLTGKDRAENVMIVDVLRNDLGRVCEPGTMRVPRLCRLERTAAVQHLVSTVTGRLAAGRDAFDLLAASFPGGSITGAPKIRAMEILEGLEPVRRGPYTGALGWIGPDGAMQTSILIRTFVADGRRLTLHVGGGITWGSDPAAEWDETVDKARGPLGAIGGEEVG